MKDKIERIQAMLAETEKEYNGHAVKDENGMYTPERIYKNIKLHGRMVTLKEVLNVLEES